MSEYLFTKTRVHDMRIKETEKDAYSYSSPYYSIVANEYEYKYLIVHLPK